MPPTPSTHLLPSLSFLTLQHFAPQSLENAAVRIELTRLRGLRQSKPQPSFLQKALPGLNPLKRVNSILTAAFSSDCRARGWKVKKDSDSKKVVEGVGGIFFDLI